MTVNPTNRFPSGVTLSVTGLPAGATLNAPAPNPASTTATFSIATKTRATGSYPLTITGTSGALTHTVAATLVVVKPVWGLSVSPGSQSAVPGGTTGNYTVTVNTTNGFSSGVTLSVTWIPGRRYLERAYSESDLYNSHIQHCQLWDCGGGQLSADDYGYKRSTDPHGSSDPGSNGERLFVTARLTISGSGWHYWELHGDGESHKRLLKCCDP